MSRDQRKYKEQDKQKRKAGKHLGGWMLLPPLSGCVECGRDHPDDQPHDVQQLHYQYSFFDREGRWPTWADAMAHCPEHVQVVWTAALAARGVDVNSTKVNGATE